MFSLVGNLIIQHVKVVKNMEEEITLQQFIEETQEELSSFKPYWESMGESHPNTFPKKLFRGDWMEQFIFYSDKN